MNCRSHKLLGLHSSKCVRFTLTKSRPYEMSIKVCNDPHAIFEVLVADRKSTNITAYPKESDRISDKEVCFDMMVWYELGPSILESRQGTDKVVDGRDHRVYFVWVQGSIEMPQSRSDRLQGSVRALFGIRLDAECTEMLVDCGSPL